MEEIRGSVSIEAQNIMPIIKKWLYSDKDIFIREVVSNGCDAITKLRLTGTDTANCCIRVEVDKEKKELRFIDDGVGMTADEVRRYINQVAFSSAAEFMKQVAKDEAEDKDGRGGIIGHFGLGFYSVFMVSEKVEIDTLSWQEGAEAVHWQSEDGMAFEMSAGTRAERGTTVTLHIAKDEEEFLEASRLRGILSHYCGYMAYPVMLFDACAKPTEREEPVEGETDKDGKPKTKEVEKPWIINDVAPLWKKAPADIKDEEYNDFYHTLYPMNFGEPLFHIHLNVDYPFNLTGILYFPKVKNRYEFQRNKIQLYCNEVFVTDSVEGILPEFLSLLHGVIDSPDIPLNVSRSFLQSDQNVKKISTYITKKVAEKLEELFKKDREAYEKNWDDIRVFIEYGMMSDPKFYERAEKFFLFKDTDDKYYTIEEYKALIKENQTDKNKALVYLYATDKDDQYTNIENAKAKGYNVLMMDGILDPHFISTYEQKEGEKGDDNRAMFARVDSNTIDKLIVKDDKEAASGLDDKQKETVKAAFEKVIDKVKFNVEFSNEGAEAAPVEVTQNEWMRRMKEMEQMGGGPMSFYGSMPDSYTLMLNTNSPVITGLLDKDEAAQEATIRQIYDLALLSKNLLKGKDLSAFVWRNM